MSMAFHMIRNTERWRAWEDAHIASRPHDVARAFAMADALYQEAKALGVWDRPFSIEDIRHKIELAKLLRVSGTARAARR